MIEYPEFAAGLGVIALQLNKPITPPISKAYHAALQDRTEGAEWDAFCEGAALRFGWQFLPTVPQLHDALQEFRGAPPLPREATEAYEQVLGAGQYTPEGGTTWTYRGVLAVCGRAAADAFLAAGGNYAFATTWDEEKRRERFIAEYAIVARQVPADRLLPAGAALALPSGEVYPDTPISQDEAEKTIERLRDIVGVEAAPPAPKTVIASEERLAELRRQAAAITSEQAEPARAE